MKHEVGIPHQVHLFLDVWCQPLCHYHHTRLHALHGVPLQEVEYQLKWVCGRHSGSLPAARAHKGIVTLGHEFGLTGEEL